MSHPRLPGTLDPRIGWFGKSLANSFDTYLFGTYHFDTSGACPRREKADGVVRVQVDRTEHNALWLPSAADLRGRPGLGRAIIATLIGFAAAPERTLVDKLGALVGKNLDLTRFRALCRYFVNTNGALLEAVEKSGAPDVVVATDLETLPAGVAISESTGAYLVYDAHEYWPRSYIDFEHWEVEFWQNIERQLLSKADLRLTVTPDLAKEMEREYGCPFNVLPNCSTLHDGSGFDLEAAYAQRKIVRSLQFLFQGNFAAGRGLEQLIRAWALVESEAQLILRGPDNPFKTHLVELAASLGLLGEGVVFPPAVTEDKLITEALSAHVGVISYDPSYYIYRFCGPNKLSQYCAAGLPILSSTTKYVERVVREHNIGFSVHIEDAAAVAALVDSLRDRREELIQIGRRARAFYEMEYNWEHFATPIVDDVRSKWPPVKIIPSLVDLSWIEQRGPVIDRRKNVVKAEHGASIRASSVFVPRPHDADYLLRPATANGYASGLADGSGSRWVEIDLGGARVVEAGRIEWFDQIHFGIEFAVEGRLYLDEDWDVLYLTKENGSAEVAFKFAPRWMRYVRLSGSRFAGQDHMLIRRFEVFACLDEIAAGALPAREEKAPVDVNQAEQGASIRAASVFAPRPHDADYLLRPATANGYASGLANGTGTRWVEIDLGGARAVEAGRIQWFDQIHFGIEFAVEGRLYLDEDWDALYLTNENGSVEVAFKFAPRWIRYVRLSGSRFAGQDHMFIRRFQLFTCRHQTAAGALLEREESA